MADYEFSSPGEHMASKSSPKTVYAGSAGYAKVYDKPYNLGNVNYGTPPGLLSNGTYKSSVVYAPNNSSYSISKDNDYDDDFIYRGGSNRSVDDYLAPYIKYNDDLFTRAQDYDIMMSNTSIRRQMEDLKAAGINPILAGRLGGAQYKGVSAPYVTINPAGVLSAYATFQGNKMNYDARMQEIASREKISENELKNRMEIAEKQILKDLNVAGINNATLLEIADKNNFTDKEITEMINAVKVEIQDTYNEVLKEMNDKDIDSDKEIAKNSNITQLIRTGIIGVGLIVSSFIKNHNDKDKFGGSGSVSLNGSKFADRSFYNKKVLEAMAGTSVVGLSSMVGVPLLVP